MNAQGTGESLVILKGRYGVIFTAVMNAIIPRGGAFAPGALDYDLLPRAERMLRSYDPAVSKIFPLVLDYVQFSALFRKGRLFTALDENRAIRLLASMEKSPFYYRRMTVLLLKLITMLAFYEDDGMARLTGYEHGWCRLEEGVRE